MNIKPRHMHKGDIIRGLELLTEPYKIAGSRDLRADTKCVFCGNEESNRVLSEIKRRVFDGCGCQKIGKILLIGNHLKIGVLKIIKNGF